ncbi:MAG: hypothetical protein H8D87_20150 [Deltaproteobacteria bacterium]|nr:hypothetical protein [Candidatus Desulfobacula maris]
MLIDYPMAGSATRASWLTAMANIFGTTGDVFALPAPTWLYYGSATAPADGSPWWFAIDFQEAMALKTLNWFPYSTDGVPSPLKIYGSATGAFSGEETLIQTFTDKVGLGDQIGISYTIDTPQSFQYYKFEIISFAETYGLKYDYFYGISFGFAQGVYAFDTVADYIEPQNKIVGDDGWTFERRQMNFTDPADKFWSIVCMLVEDFGWEVEVDSFPTKMIVKSKGVDDDQPYIYFHLTLAANTLRPDHAYGYWDSVTKVGTLELPHTNNYADRYEQVYYDETEGSIGLCVWGNKDLIIMNSYENKTANYKEGAAMIGRIPKDVMFIPAHTTLLASQVAATDVSLNVASSAGFEVGLYYCLWGAEGEGRDFGVMVTEITDATHIVVDNLPRDYSAGSFIGNYPQTGFYPSYYFHNFGQRFKSGLIEEYGTFDQNDIAGGYNDPAGALGKNVLFPLIWREVNGEGTDPGVLSMDKHIAAKLDSQTAFDIHLVGAGLPGTATGGGAKTLEDTAKAWTIDEHIGKFVYISAGTGAHDCGNFAEIVSNMADTLTVAYDWLTDPVAGDTYYIADEIWQVPVDFIYYGGPIKCGG